MMEDIFGTHIALRADVRPEHTRYATDVRVQSISQITGNNVALRDQYTVVGSETIRLPQPPEFVPYLRRVRELQTLGPPAGGCRSASLQS